MRNSSGIALNLVTNMNFYFLSKTLSVPLFQAANVAANFILCERSFIDTWMRILKVIFLLTTGWHFLKVTTFSISQCLSKRIANVTNN
jgi:hypothetical protein